MRQGSKFQVYDPQGFADRIVFFWLPHHEQARQLHVYQNYPSPQSSVAKNTSSSSSNCSGKTAAAAGKTVM